jgi:hypothetical protein
LSNTTLASAEGPLPRSRSRAVTASFQTRYLPVSATKRCCSSPLSATPLAKLKPLATTRVAFVAGSCSRIRPVQACSTMSSTAASKVPPQDAGANRPDASLK